MAKKANVYNSSKLTAIVNGEQLVAKGKVARQNLVSKKIDEIRKKK